MLTRLTTLCSIALFIFGLSSPLFAEVGKVIIAKGETFALDEANGVRELQRRSDILPGDTLVTGDNSELHIRFQDNAVLALRANSRLKINEYHGSTAERDEKVLMELLSGGFRTITGTFGKSDSDAYQIRTPNASIGIRGTNYEALLTDRELLVGVYEGGVRLTNQAGAFDLGLDSAFSFAKVNGNNQVIQGLVEPPSELKIPLATSVNTPAEPNEEREEETTANLSSDDDDLLISNLFDEPDADSDDTQPTLVIDDSAPTLLTNESSTESSDAVDEIAQQTDLSLYADVRLTQDQILSLLNSEAKAGFVVVSDDPQGYRASVYEMPYDYGQTVYSTAAAVDFTISVRSGDQTIQYNISIPASSNNLISEIETQVAAQTNSGSTLTAPPLLNVDTVNGKLVFTSYLNDPNVEIVFSDFTGADATLAQQELGLCDLSDASTCMGTYAASNVSVNEYNKATHFGYMVKSKQGPVFVNWESETLSIIGDTYKTPDNVFRGNSNATRTVLNSVDIREDGTNAIEWGYWNTSATAPAVLLKDPADLAMAESIDAPFFYVTAPPASKARLTGTRSMTSVVNWHATSSTSNGLMSDGNGSATLTATLDVSFDDAEAVGSLTLMDIGATPDWSWSVNYYGTIQGAQFQSDYGYGNLSLDGGNQSYGAVGHVDGLFTNTATDVGFAGGFNLQTTDDSHYAQGVFVLK
ncbi:FecR family protein [Reinekea blandensis]|uniref:FecR protein domain-containing protein n=1 Tax=Reinekea blandensis MED297 TaxID=314283 RepID=A4BBW9_9GAMM|nr:FecR family protein [Reinekea blandensis]EAR10454.1 hypothetical protein MED297_01495 [Reinekea sp. MED297] [Reinekea blandensis MED297]